MAFKGVDIGNKLSLLGTRSCTADPLAKGNIDAAMAALAPERWWVDAPGLARALRGATEVRTVDDPHLRPWWPEGIVLDPAPRLFPLVERPCSSFSQWWTRATRGLRHAEELLRRDS